MSYRYRAFGLSLESDHPIPGLEPNAASAAPDVVIRLLGDRPLPSLADINVLHQTSDWPDDRLATLVVRRSADRRSFLFDYRDGTRFLIEDRGARIWAQWPPPLTPEDTATYLLGPVLGFVLRLGGHICLHASSVVVGDGAVAFLGPSGAGKSTLASALVAQGHRALTEDVTPLRQRDGCTWVESGYPVIRLWESSVHSLFGAPDAMPLLTPNWDKRFQSLSEEAGSFTSAPRPLRAIYVLDPRRLEPDTAFRTLTPPEALIELVRNTYGNQWLDREMRAREFDLLGGLVQQVAVRAVQFADDFASLPRVCAEIVSDAVTAPKAPALAVQP